MNDPAPEKVTAWKTSDGQLHLDLEGARAHQGVLNFRKWYNNNEIEPDEYHTVGFDNFYAWWTDHRVVLAKLFAAESGADYFSIFLTELRKAEERDRDESSE